MPNYVYAVFHDGLGKVLIGKKNKKGYFFHNNKGEGDIIPNGKSLNTAGEWVFPGGKLEGGDEAEGALKEFGEETDIYFTDIELREQPDSFKGKMERNNYYGVYFEVDGEILKSLVNDVNNNLKEGRKAAEEVKKGFKGDYSELMKKYKNSPMDNELDHMKVCSLDDALYEWEDDKEVDWFYNILFKLKYGV